MADQAFTFGDLFGDARLAELRLLSWIDQRGEASLPPVAAGPWRDLLIALVSTNLLTTFSYEAARQQAISQGRGSSPSMESPSGIAGESLLERAVVSARVRALDQLYLGAGGAFRLSHPGRVRLSELKQVLRSGREREPFGILWDARHWEQDLQVALVDASDGTPLTVAYLDMNGLKALNDQHGHGAGDDGLRMYFQAVTSALGDHGQAYRLSGDEVLAIVPRSDAPKTAKLLERACLQLMRDSLKSQPEILLSISVGVVVVVDPMASPSVVRDRADRVQYRAKAASKVGTPRPSVIAIENVDYPVVLLP
jgi:diguanylate cyclase (GGDEF)-like protein